MIWMSALLIELPIFVLDIHVSQQQKWNSMHSTKWTSKTDSEHTDVWFKITTTIWCPESLKWYQHLNGDRQKMTYPRRCKKISNKYARNMSNLKVWKCSIQYCKQSIYSVLHLLGFSGIISPRRTLLYIIEDHQDYWAGYHCPASGISMSGCSSKISTRGQLHHL